jgi:hypothetical protein
MSSDRPEVLQLLSVLMPGLASCNERFLAKSVGMGLYGLKNMHSDKSEVLQLLSVLSPLLESCDGRLSAQDVGMALYGLQNMSSDRSEVLQLLSALTPLVKSYDGQLSAQAVGMSLFGLQNMSSDQPEVLQLLSVLIPILKSFDGSLPAQTVGMALMGLSNLDVLDCKVLVDEFVGRMFEFQSQETMQPMNQPSITSLIVAADSLLQSNVYVHATWIGKMESLRQSLLAQLQLHECSDSGSKIEAKAIKVSKQLFSETVSQVNSDKIPIDLRALHVQVDSNIWLHGYEADIVLRISGEYRGVRIVDTVVNVEVDGPSHSSLSSRRHNVIREWRMRQEGVRVERWKDSSALDLPGGTEERLIELVREVAQSKINGKS